ncbi:MAG TPA: CAP domain-containing protein, partial [Acidimicrobiia bacterium]|nr:CAP domain-containing protein [Acidimicrobiia bacterium]
TAFMNSPSHRENILDPAFTQLGVGVTFDGSKYLYVAVIFRQPAGAASTPAPAPSTPPTTRAAAAPKPKPPTPTTAPPTTTTTHAPTTTTTAPPQPPPVELVVAPPVEAPPPVETTTTTAPRPVFDNPDFLAANFSDRLVPAASRAPVPVHTPVQLVVTAVLGVVMGAAGTATAYRRLPRRPKA